MNAETEAEAEGLGVYEALGSLSPATVLTEAGLARLCGKACIESVKRAVERGELPMPVRFLGRNSWTAGAIIRHLEARLEEVERRVAKLRP